MLLVIPHLGRFMSWMEGLCHSAYSDLSSDLSISVNFISSLLFMDTLKTYLWYLMATAAILLPRMGSPAEDRHKTGRRRRFYGLNDT